MLRTYTHKPGFKFQVFDKVYAFQEDGTFTTTDEIMQTALEQSRYFRAGEMTFKEEPLRVAVKIYSPILEGFLWVVQDSGDWPHLHENGVPVYDAGEIRELKRLRLSPDELRAACNVKKVFKGQLFAERVFEKESENHSCGKER